MPKQGRAREHVPTEVAGDEKFAMARFAVFLISRKWFTDLEPAPAFPFLPLLLLGVYISDNQSDPMSKKEAGAFMGAGHVQTARGYIALAQTLGLVEIKQSTEDKRKELLVGTDALRTLVNKELVDLLEQMQHVFGVNRVPVQGVLVEKEISLEQRPQPSSSRRPDAVRVGASMVSAVKARRQLKILAHNENVALVGWPAVEKSGSLVSSTTPTGRWSRLTIFRKLIGIRSKEFIQAIEHALNCVDQEKYADAIFYFDNAIQLEPDDPEGYHGRGITYLMMDKEDQAIINFTKAIELDPKHFMAYCNRGLAYTAKDEYGQAIKNFEKAIELEPEDPDGYAGRGYVYSEQNKHECAITDLTKAIELDPERLAFHYYARGRVYSKNDEYDRAINDFTKAIELDSEDPDAYYERGIVFSMQNNHECAIADHSKAIELAPEEALFWDCRAETHLQAGHYAMALIDSRKAVKLAPNTGEVLVQRGRILEALGRREEAIADFRRALAIDVDLLSAKEALERLGVAY